MALHLVSVWLFANTAVVIFLAFLYSANRISEQVSATLSLRHAADYRHRRAEVMMIDGSRPSHSVADSR